jgi:hypothetical protein
MNLEKMNLVELNPQEMKETEGGFFGFLVAAFIAWVYYELITN